MKKRDLVKQLDAFDDDVEIRVRVYLPGGDLTRTKTVTPNRRISRDDAGEGVLLHVELDVDEPIAPGRGVRFRLVEAGVRPRRNGTSKKPTRGYLDLELDRAGKRLSKARLRVAELRRLHEAGMSVTDIARRVCSTPNAVWWRLQGRERGVQ